MRLFTSLSITLLLTLFGSIAYAQYDMAVTDVDINSNSSNEIPDGHISAISFTIENVGSSELDSGIFFGVGVLLNGDTIAYSVFVSLGWDAGISNTLTTTQTTTFNSADVTTAPEVCGFIILDTTASEPNLLNNVHCETFTISSSVSNDWSLTAAYLATPYNVVDSFDLNNCPDQGKKTAPEIDSMHVSFLNEGELTAGAGTPIKFQVIMHGDTNNISMNLHKDVPPGEGIDTVIMNSSSTNFDVLKKVKQKVGNYPVCIRVNMPNDFNSSNDDSCDVYKIYDTFDPNDKSCWVLGQTELTAPELDAFYSIGMINITGVSSQTQVIINDLSGKMVAKHDINSNDQISTTGLTPGVYLIRANSEDGSTLNKPLTVY